MSGFKFEFSQKAARHNSNILMTHDYDLEKAISAFPGSTVTPGSELRPFLQLDQLLSHHPHFERFKTNSTVGIDYEITELSENERIKELRDQLERGNHKSALTKEAEPIVNKLMQEDVSLGYAIPITKDCLLKLKHAELYPCGLQHQMTVNEAGEVIPKKRVTHDLSNRKKHGRSINQRVIEESLPPTTYGFALLRFIHLIHHIRRHNPKKRILMMKTDFDKAYRRLHTHPRIAAKCIAEWITAESDNNKITKREFIAAILTRLPFGSTPAPAEFSICSEMIFDLANDLLHCPYWDPDELTHPHRALIEEPEYLPDEIPFAEALEADVKLPKSQKAGTEGYIDDGATAALEESKESKRIKKARHALPMATHLVFRPNKQNEEPLPRPDPLSIRKLKAEARLSEMITFLGWRIDSRRLTMSLPDEKLKIWTESIDDLLQKMKTDFETIQTLVGRLNHVGYIIPNARHFLNNIRRLEYIADKFGTAKIQEATKKDLELWKHFLKQANRGFSLNSIVFRIPTSLCFSDACEWGMGGYCMNSGRAWRYEFTKREREVFTLNTKEFMASVITEEVNIPHDPSDHPCMMNIGDSSCTTSWMNKSNFDPEQAPIHNELARRHARTIIDRQASNYSQHIPGLTNTVADCLSRDFHLTNTKLIAMIYDVKPAYLPQQMKIIELPKEITSWIASLALMMPRRKELPQKPTPSTLALGVSGWNSRQEGDSTTPIWRDTALKNAYRSSEHSCTLPDVETLIHDRTKFKGPLRDRPSAMWHRPLFRVVGQTQRRTQQEKPPCKYQDRQEHTN